MYAFCDIDLNGDIVLPVAQSLFQVNILTYFTCKSVNKMCNMSHIDGNYL